MHPLRIAYYVVTLSNKFFFFSSRRRHTRYIGDWSSDVCSSDLFRNRDAAHRAELLAADTVEVLAPAELVLLRREAVPVDRGLRRAAGRRDEGQSRQGRPLVHELVTAEIAEPEE